MDKLLHFDYLRLIKNNLLEVKEFLRFSGHETFHCKEQWLTKGVQLFDYKEVDAFNDDIFAIAELGVGKNMVKSIHHWLKAFGWINTDGEITPIARKIIEKDIFLENESSVWLLQYHLCKEEYASIFKIIFLDYFADKVTQEFSEKSVINYINRRLQQNGTKSVSENTLSSDFNVFLKTYVAPVKNIKTVEDDFNAPLLQLNLISKTNRRNESGELVYKVNLGEQSSISPYLFMYFISDSFENETVVNLDSIRKILGSFLCLTLDSLENLISQICNLDNRFVYKDDAGIKQLQIKTNTPDFKQDLLSSIYEN